MEILFKGLGGYELVMLADDDRSWYLVRHGKTESDLYSATMENAPGFFPNIANETVEWRGVWKGKTFVPHAIIFRVTGVDEESRVVSTRLLVFGLKDGKATYLGHAQGAGEGGKAREIADAFAP